MRSDCSLPSAGAEAIISSLEELAMHCHAAQRPAMAGAVQG